MPFYLVTRSSPHRADRERGVYKQFRHSYTVSPCRLSARIIRLPPPARRQQAYVTCPAFTLMRKGEGLQCEEEAVRVRNARR